MPEEPLTKKETAEEEPESKFISAEALQEEKSAAKEQAEGKLVIRTMQKDIEALKLQTPEALAAKKKAEEETKIKVEKEAKEKAEEEEKARLEAGEAAALKTAEEEERLKAEAEERAALEAKTAAEEERVRIEAEQAKAAEEARVRAEQEELARKGTEAEEKTRREAQEALLAEARAAEEEKARAQAEEQARLETEAAKKGEEETLKAAEEERMRMEEEERIRKEAEAREKAEAIAVAEKAAMEEEVKVIPGPPVVEKPPAEEEIVITKVKEFTFFKSRSFRFILSGLAVILIAVSGFTIYWRLFGPSIKIPFLFPGPEIPDFVPPEGRVEPIAPSEAPPIEKEIEVEPSSFFSKQPEKTVTLTALAKTKEALLETFMLEAQTQEDPDVLKRVIIKTGDHFLTLQEFFETLEIKTPPGWLANFNATFNLFFYRQQEGFRWGMIVKWRDAQKALNDMKAWETTGLDKDFDALFLNIVKGEPVAKEFLDDTTRYKNVDARYMNFPFEDLSIDYAFYKDYLIFASSRKSLYKAIDLLVPEEELQQ